MSGFAPCWDPEVTSLSPPLSYHPDLKKLVEKLPYFNTTIYWCCYTHVRLITTKNTLQRRLLLPRPGSAAVHDCAQSDLPFLFSSSSWVLRAPAGLICSLVFLTRRSTAVVVLWMKCPALVTPTLKHPYFKKTPITSAGMSRQAMSTTATVGCLNSCYAHAMSVRLRVSRGYSAP